MQHNEGNPGTFKDLAMHRLWVAEEDLDTAKENYESGRLRAANNRAYYSIYHAITAVLAMEEVAFKRHKDTVAYFNKEYVKTEKFSRQLGRAISRAEEIRHASDYDEFYLASKIDTEKQIETAETLLKAVKAFVQNSEQ